ncbi:hypothetical protein PM082_015486 [Marasmius tenuissimus]|nr:hypothetical protein PM082_015486 [Marasmius tenuissimus]
MPSPAIKACHAILDFIYLAQFAIHGDETLAKMQHSLDMWEENRDAFIESSTQEDFNIPKFHSLVHYIQMIRLFGATDNYNTEMFKRLHIVFAKKGWRASNKRNEFPQMTTWLLRQENVAAFDCYIAHGQRERLKALAEEKKKKEREEAARKEVSEPTQPMPEQSSSNEKEKEPPLALVLQERRGMKLTKAPSATQSIATIETLHNVKHFIQHLTAFLSLHQQSRLSEVPFCTLDVYHTLKFTWENHEGNKVQETVHCSPERKDPVIVLTGDTDTVSSLTGTRIGRVQVIFKLPEVVVLPGLGSFKAHKSWLTYPLAYIEWYSKATKTPHKHDLHEFSSVSKAYGQDKVTPQWSIIPLCNIRQTCMLLPNFKKSPQEGDWTSGNVLDKAEHYFTNHLQSVQRYKMF